MKASFPPFASCFLPWSGFASPRRLHRRATGAFVGCKNQTSLTAIVKQNSQVSQIAHSPFGGRSPQLLQIATPASRTQPCPVARRCNRRGLAKPDHRGNIQGDGWRLRRSGHANFPCHGAQNGSAASHFNSTDFHVTHSLLWYFLGLQESTVTPRSPRPLLPRLRGGGFCGIL